MTTMADYFHLAVIFIIIFCQLDALPIDVEGKPTLVSEPSTRDILEGLTFLKKYHYLNVESNKDGDLPSTDEITSALQTMQRYAGVDQTGKFDPPTMEMMKKPRCGVADVVVRVQDEDSSRVRRYNVAGARSYRWFVNRITYKIDNYPSQSQTNLNSPLTHNQVDAIIEDAFKVWSDVAPLEFIKADANDPVDIHLLFGSRSHTTVYLDPVFDGEGGTLAHAFTPNSGWGDTNGDVHFDDDEVFTHQIYSGANLFYVATHEIGHALGLDHSDNRNALMWPYERGYNPNFQLPADDIAGIQAIYGPRPTDKPLPPAYCNITFNAVAVIYQKLYVFSDTLLWQFTLDGDLLTNPDGEDQRIHFKSLPRRIQSVYERWHDGRIIFLKGERFYAYDGTIAATPKGGLKIKEYLSSDLPKSITAAIHNNTRGTTDFLRGKKVWRLDEIYGGVKKGFPKRFQPDAFPGLPNRPTGAFADKNGDIIVLKGNVYYRYTRTSEELYQLLSNNNSTPQLFAQDYLNCADGITSGITIT
ncbi:matrix metalloproteinase-18-like [Amphiura filiformis]|uniref:matrix metalloproteinase-18-like n=1 Tax=Amphiura filiformis TaxID=82378 RepID=UPI003B21D461